MKQRRWLIALAIVLVWLFVVYTQKESFTNVPPPTTAALQGQVTLLEQRMSTAEDNITDIQKQVKSANDAVTQGQQQVAAAQAGIAATVSS